MENLYFYKRLNLHKRNFRKSKSNNQENYLFKILTKNNSKRSIEFLIGNYFDNE